MPSREETERLCRRKKRRWEGAGAHHGPAQHLRAASSSSAGTGRPHVPCPLFLKFLSQRGCQGRGIVKSSPPCHECASSSGAGGQKLFAISSGRDLCFDHGRGGLQSIKPSPGLRRGQGKGLPSASGGGCLSKGQKDTHLPLGFGGEAGGMPGCSLSWRFKLPDGVIQRGKPLCVPHNMLPPKRFERVCFNFLSWEGCLIAIYYITEWGKMSCRACA